MSSDLSPRGVVRALPVAAHDFTQFVVDNPAQSVALVSGSIVLTRVLVNLVRPRNPIEALALLVVIEALSVAGVVTIVKKGWMPFKIRDDDGNPVTVLAGKVQNEAETSAPTET